MRLPAFNAQPHEDPVQEALELRARYGEDAEQWCEIGILAAGRLAQRRSLYRVLDALRGVPVEDQGAYSDIRYA